MDFMAVLERLGQTQLNLGMEYDWEVESDFNKGLLDWSEFYTNIELPDGRNLIAFTKIYSHSKPGQATIEIPIKSNQQKHVFAAQRNTRLVPEFANNTSQFMIETLQIRWQDYESEIRGSSIGMMHDNFMTNSGLIMTIFKLPEGVQKEIEVYKKPTIPNSKKMRIIADLFYEKTGICLIPESISIPEHKIRLLANK